MALVWSCGRCGAGVAGDPGLPISWEEQLAEDEWIDSHRAQHEREDDRAKAAAAAARLAETPGPALQDAAAVELADAARRLQSLAGVDDQGRDACRHRADVDALLRHRRSVIEQLDAVAQDTRQMLEDLSAQRPISEAARARVLGAGRGLRRAATPPCPVDTFTVLDPLQTRLQDVTTALLNLTAARAVDGAR